MDPVIVSTIGVGMSVIGVGAGLAALILHGLRDIRAELKSLSAAVSRLDRSLSRFEGAFAVAFSLPRPPEYPKPNRDRPD